MNKPYFQDLIKWRPWIKRKDIYSILKETIAQEYRVDLEEWQIQKIVRAHRTLQEIIPNDQVGEILEKRWRAERGMESVFEALDRVSKVQTLI